MADDGWIDVPHPAASDDGWISAGNDNTPSPPISGPGGPFTGSDGLDVAKTVYPSLGPILQAFGHGAKEGWGDTPLGLPPDAVKWLSDKGVFGPEKGGYQNPFQAFNEMLAHTVVGAVQIAGRAGSAALGSYQEGVAKIGEQTGQPELGRDLAAMPEAFFGSPGSLGEIKVRSGLPKDQPVGKPLAPLTPAPPIDAFHGSPYSFEAFSGEKIGTGEGAQSFGHGLYFAENPKVAGGYAEKLGGGEGNLYQVRINVDPEKMLDLDKPLNEQTPFVRQAVKQAMGIDYNGNFDQALSDRKWNEHQYADGKTAVRNGFIAFSDERVSQRLSQAGIPGSKYLDSGSRDNPATGTRNFVVFNESDVQITHKNGISVETEPGSLPPAIAEARDLGVIGPDKPDMTTASPAEKAAAEVPPPMAARAARGDTISGPEPGGPEKAGNIRLDQIGINADAKDVILDAAKNNDDFNQARAGNVPLAQVESLSGASGVPSEVLTGNDGLGRLMHNDAGVRTWLQAFHQATDEIAEQMRVVANTGDEADIAKLRDMKLRFQHMQEQVSGLTAEAGRTLGVFREFYANKGKAEALGKILEDNPGLDAESMKKLADAGKGLDDPAQVARLLHDSNKPTFWDKYLYYWVNALISGPVTHAKYIGANAAFGAYEAGVVTPIAGALGAARRLAGGTDGVYVGEAAARTWGLLAGTPDALRAAWQAAKNNVMTPFPNEVAGKAVNPLTQVRPNPIGGKLGFAIGIPGRSAAGIHSFFRFLGYRAEVEAQAYRQAAKEGLSPISGSFWDRRGTLADHPTEAMMNAGVENGNHLTFISEQGEFGKAISRLANTRLGPGGMQPFKLILPFTHIPGQILRAGLEQTPAAFLDSNMRADLLGKNGAVAADTARARLIAGGAVSAMVANWAVNDTITGYGPTDQTERAQWLRTHEPYSVRLGGWWYSYNKFGPIGDLVGLVANLVDVGPKVGEGEYADAAGHVMKATSRILEDEVGMQGLVNLIEALDDPDRKMSRFVAGQAASNLPYSSLIRQTASFNDPYMREAKNFVDELRYAVPYARQELLPKRDWLGAPMDNPGYQSIIRQRAVNADPVDLAVSQLRGFRPAPPQARIGGVALPPKMYNQYQATAGAMTRAALESIVTAPGWGQIPPGIREQTVHSIVENARKTAGSMMQARHPELILQGIRDRQDKIAGTKPTKLKD